MGLLRDPLPVKLFIGLLAADISLLDACASTLVAAYGPVDLESDLLPWDHSTYYQAEMGAPLARKFLFFSRLIDPGSLAQIKRATVVLEESFTCRTGDRSCRRVNIDPGYVTEAKVVLATTKDFSHRVYIGNGVFAEVTLQYARDEQGYRPFSHTYPDFRSPALQVLFSDARERLRKGLNREISDRRG